MGPQTHCGLGGAEEFQREKEREAAVCGTQGQSRGA